MSHLDVILIIVTVSISSTLGVYLVWRCINQHTNPPINSLTRRSGDIELQYIEPSTNNTLDLLQPQRVYNSNINSCLEDSINLQRSQSYWSCNPPSYNSTTINSCLEDSINLQRIPSFLNDLTINSCLEDSINLNYYIFFIVVLTIIILSLINKLR